jgi:NADH-quinone oxidoreductase subunit L
LAPGQKPHETSWVVTVPLILLAIPSVVIGYIAIEPMLFDNYFGNAIYINEAHEALKEMAREFHGPMAKVMHGLHQLPMWLALAGVVLAWFLYLVRPEWPAIIKKRFNVIYIILDNKYFCDRFNAWFFAGAARGFSSYLWKTGDIALIDGIMVNGSAKLVGFFSSVVRYLQTGYIYHYAFSMIIGVFVLLYMRSWF